MYAYCQVPAGDTPTSSRLYDAIACDCIPVVISDDISPHLAFREQVSCTHNTTVALLSLGPHLC